MMENFEKYAINTVIVIALITTIVSFVYGFWYMKRSINAWLYYDGVTTEQVCEMVKPEYIKDGYCK